MHTCPGEQEFASWLLQLGNGTLFADINPRQPDVVEIPQTCKVAQSLLESIYRNATCTAVSLKIAWTSMNMCWTCYLVRLYRTSVQIASNVTTKRNDIIIKSNIIPSGMPPHVLNLKAGCIVMLVHNLSLRQGLCNGTRLKPASHSKSETGSK